MKVLLLACALVASEPMQAGRGVRVVAAVPQQAQQAPDVGAPEIAPCLDAGQGSCITPRLVFRPGSRAVYPQVIR